MAARARSATKLLPWVAAVLALAGCASRTQAPGSAGRPQVVAAENFWGNIAAQLAGSRLAVRSIIVNPDTDPHSYEPNAGDAITLAGSRMAIVDGIGYDPWASQLLAADSSSSRVVLNVGTLLGLRAGDNPHQWYSPASVQRVIGQIVSDYRRLDPRDAAYFNRRRASFESEALAPYRRLLAEIRSRYRGVPVGYSESIFEPLGQALGLRLLTPKSFAKAIAEGSDVSAADKQAVDAQAQQHRIKVWVYNRQNTTPDVQRVNQIASAAQIPVTTITETLAPASASFEQWQVAELTGLLQALHRATGR